MKRLRILFALFVAAASHAIDNIESKRVPYNDGHGPMEGFVAYLPPKDPAAARLPGVLIVHDWMGLGAFAESKAQELAKLGYVAFAADIYGQGVRPKDSKEASQLAGKYKGDRSLLQSRVRAAYNELKKMKNVDAQKIVVMGYCFGGTTALELGRSGAELAGIVSFHGGLQNPTPANAKKIQAPVLVLHGADDPFVPPAEVKAFYDEMQAAKVAVRFVPYAGAVHAFAVPGAGSDKSKGAAYNSEADQKSWAEFTRFLRAVAPSPQLPLAYFEVSPKGLPAAGAQAKVAGKNNSRPRSVPEYWQQQRDDEKLKRDAQDLQRAVQQGIEWMLPHK